MAPMRGIAGRLLLAVLSTALALLVIEASLRLVLPHRGVPETVYERYHPIFGWENRPNAGNTMTFEGASTFRGRHNSRGLLDTREIPYEKPPGVTRVLLLGDSFFWGYGVNNEEVISAVLQTLVAPRVEILNGACSGYGTDQELLWLVQEGIRYRPDVVVLGLFPANDWEDISTPFRYGRAKPFYRLEGRRLNLHNVPVPDPHAPVPAARRDAVPPGTRLVSLLREHSHLYPFVMGRLQSTPRLGDWMRRRGLYDPAVDDSIGSDVEVLPEREIQPLFEALLHEISSFTRNAGADFLLVFIPQKENSPGGATRYQGVQQGADLRNDEASRYLRQVTALNRYPYLDLLPLVRSRHSRGAVLYTPGGDDHHWTPLGHRMAAEAVAGWLAARITAPTR